jgi:uncharacterized protein DUF4412
MKLSTFLRLTPYVLSLSVYADLTVVQEITTADPSLSTGTQEMTLVVAKDKLRIEHAQGGMISLPGEKKTVMLMHPQRMYLIMAANDPRMGGSQGMMGGKDGDKSVTSPEEINWEKTGQKAKIAGYDAEQWVGKDKTSGKMVAELWVGGPAELGREYYDGLGSGGGMLGGLTAKLQAMKNSGPYGAGYPLKTVSYDDNGQPTATTIVKKLETSPADPKWFAIPEGYMEMKMPGGMGAMPQGTGE